MPKRRRVKYPPYGTVSPDLFGDSDETADRNYIKEFVLARSMALGREYGVEFAEAFHYIGPRTSRRSRGK